MSKLLINGKKYIEHKLDNCEVWKYAGGLDKSILFITGNLENEEYFKAKIINNKKEELDKLINRLINSEFNFNKEYGYEVKENKNHKVLIIYRN